MTPAVGDDDTIPGAGPADHDDGTIVSSDPRSFRIDGSTVTILGSRCDDTGVTFWPPRLRSPITGGQVSDVELSSTGTVWAWTFVNNPWHGMQPPGTDDGYAAGLIDLDHDGPRVAAVLFGRADTWAVGDRACACPLPMAVTNSGVVALLAFRKLDGRSVLA